MSDMREMSRDFIREFIDIYRQHPCLWQVTSKDYKNKCKKFEAYKILTKKLQTVHPTATKHNVIGKINTLRSGFRREYRKVQKLKYSKNGSDTNEVYVPSLWYYDILTFVREQDTSQRSNASDTDEELEEHDKNNDIVKTRKEVRIWHYFLLALFIYKYFD